MIGFPLDSHVEFDRDGNPSFDRGITSAPLRSLIKSLMTDGVLPDASRLFDDITSDSFKVVPDENMTVKVKKGFGICNGCLKFNDTETPLTLEDSDRSSDRIDTIVLRLNNNDDVRECEFHVITGTPATHPTRPALTRNASIYDIGIADILVQFWTLTDIAAHALVLHLRTREVQFHGIAARLLGHLRQTDPLFLGLSHDGGDNHL